MRLHSVDAQIKKQANLSYSAAKQVKWKDEVPDMKPEDVILCCLIREDTHFSEAGVDGYGVMLE